MRFRRERERWKWERNWNCWFTWTTSARPGGKRMQRGCRNLRFDSLSIEERESSNAWQRLRNTGEHGNNHEQKKAQLELRCEQEPNFLSLPLSLFYSLCLQFHWWFQFATKKMAAERDQEKNINKPRNSCWETYRIIMIVTWIIRPSSQDLDIDKLFCRPKLYQPISDGLYSVRSFQISRFRYCRPIPSRSIYNLIYKFHVCKAHTHSHGHGDATIVRSILRWWIKMMKVVGDTL